MQTPPLPDRIGTRLNELNRQINDCLKDIRQYLEELEKASQEPSSKTAAARPRDFARLLQHELERPTPPKPGA